MKGENVMICPKCNTPNPDGVPACQNCGTYLAMMKQAVPGKGLAIASMVCGIVSFFCFGFILGLLAVIFGGVAKSKGYSGGMATAGIVLGVIGLAFYVVMIIACGSLIPFMNL